MSDSFIFDTCKVAVVIAAYNGEATIERAVHSALAQGLPEGFVLEVIVVDDCSTDRTPDIVKSLQNTAKSLVFLRQTENAGPSAARNRALASTDAAWFTPLDSDDFMAPERLSGLLEIAQNEDWDVVADNLLVSFDAAPETVIRRLWPGKPEGLVDLSLSRFVEQNLSSAGSRAELGYIKPLINRRVLGAGAMYRNDMRFGEDYDLYTRLLAHRARFCLSDPLGYYAVQRENSLSRSQKAVDFERLIETDRRLLKGSDCSAAENSALRRHLKESQSEWVWLRMIEAVKARKPGAMLGCFFVSSSASVALLGKLAEQAMLRTRRKLFGRRARNVVS